MKSLIIVIWTIAGSLTAAEPFLTKTDLFTAKQDGYALYRIPGIVVTAKGTVLAYCEARVTGKSDWDAIDIFMLRSTDGGKTWGRRLKMANVPGPKLKNPAALANVKNASSDDVTYNNPVAIVDRDGSVHFLFCLEYARCFYMHSDDDGVSWSKPIEITSVFDQYRPGYDWKVIATGPAHGIQLDSGRLVVPVWLAMGTEGNGHKPSQNSTIFSDDHGHTWQAGDIAIPHSETTPNASETCVVQLNNGSVMLNARNHSPTHRRSITVSKDGATGWSKPRFDDALLEHICMASIVRHGPSCILFANPHNLETLGKSTNKRRNLSIKVSDDDGQTWTTNKTLEPGNSAYSDLAVLPDGTILCFYERGGETEAHGGSRDQYAFLTVARFNFDWLKQ